VCPRVFSTNDAKRTAGPRGETRRVMPVARAATEQPPWRASRLPVIECLPRAHERLRRLDRRRVYA
jgi:hypothetical protein